jgi:hypothetical protein
MSLVAEPFEIHPPRHRFSIGGLRDILRTIKLKPPPAANLKRLAFGLNQTSGIFAFSNKYADASQRQAGDVEGAVKTLMLFFERRSEACRRLSGNTEAFRREEQLYNHFRTFLEAMQAHPFNLDMDTARFMVPLDTWRQIADLLAGKFRLAMEPQKIGTSNNGPLPRFVAAVIPLITGETPAVPNVAKHLKDSARGIRRKARAPRQKKGTVAN